MRTDPPALVLRCGCEVPLSDDVPICPHHGDVGVARAIRIPAPRFRGTASGPHVSTEDLPAWTGVIAGPGKDK